MRVESAVLTGARKTSVLKSSVVPGEEQRRFRRYSVNFPCEIKLSRQSGKRISTTTQDVSCGGLYFSVPSEWEIGSPIEFTLHLPLKAMGRRTVALRCQGKVARIVEREEQRFGIGATIERFEFVHLDSKGRQDGNKTAAGFPGLPGF
jgi:hypothetical protein